MGLPDLDVFLPSLGLSWVCLTNAKAQRTLDGFDEDRPLLGAGVGKLRKSS